MPIKTNCRHTILLTHQNCNQSGERTAPLLRQQLLGAGDALQRRPTRAQLEVQSWKETVHDKRAETSLRDGDVAHGQPAQGQGDPQRTVACRSLAEGQRMTSKKGKSVGRDLYTRDPNLSHAPFIACLEELGWMECSDPQCT